MRSGRLHRGTGQPPLDPDREHGFWGEIFTGDVVVLLCACGLALAEDASKDGYDEVWRALLDHEKEAEF